MKKEVVKLRVDLPGDPSANINETEAFKQILIFTVINCKATIAKFKCSQGQSNYRMFKKVKVSEKDLHRSVVKGTEYINIFLCECICIEVFNFITYFVCFS